MATGFAVSLAPAHDLPEWFWSSCPSAKRRLPVHLKSSLHINASNIQQNDEILGNKTAGSEFHHPLDSTSTDEVLR
jgi:mediator of RNA polymerase II transcription subunit 13